MFTAANLRDYVSSLELPSGMLSLFILVVGVVYFLFQFFTNVLPNQFLVPPQNWRDKILNVINYPTPIYLQAGKKRSAFRRRLILASCQPSYYTNFVNNKLKIQPEDAQNKGGVFMENTRKRAVDDPHRPLIYGFFHPYANNGGGGERVLWQAVQATLLASDKDVVAIYTTNTDAEPLAILDKVRDKFQISHLDSKRIVFIYLRRYGTFIDAAYWRNFTILGQLFGSALLSLEAMYELSPDVFIDTMGLPGSYFFVSLVLKIPIMAYVHYPVLQLEMFRKLKFPDFSLQSLKWIDWTARDVRELAKLTYWSILYYFYVYLGSLVDVTLTNGTWTQNHIRAIWSLNVASEKRVDILYPPCGDFDNPESMTRMLRAEIKAAVNSPGKMVSRAFRGEFRDNVMLYVAQFRPEKRHALLLDQYAKFLSDNKRHRFSSVKVPQLVFLGSCRTPDDTATLQSLKRRVQELELDVKFVVDCSYTELLAWLSRAKYGLNAMWNEHFGIGVVEYLSSGVIPVVHASAGPYLDIVTGYKQVDDDHPAWRNNTGFFFKDKSDPDFTGKRSKHNGFLLFNDKYRFPTFAQLLEEILINDPRLVSDANLEEMRENGQHLVLKFSNNAFVEKWMKYLVEISYLERVYRERRTGTESVY